MFSFLKCCKNDETFDLCCQINTKKYLYELLEIIGSAPVFTRLNGVC